MPAKVKPRITSVLPAVSLSPSETLLSLKWKELAPDAPQPVKEYRFHPVRRWRADWAWPDHMLLLEVSGGRYQFAGGRHAGDADYWKLSTAAAMGYRVLHFSPEMIAKEGAMCIDLILEALGEKK